MTPEPEEVIDTRYTCPVCLDRYIRIKDRNKLCMSCGYDDSLEIKIEILGRE